MKKICLLILAVLAIVLPVSAQTDEWQLRFEDVFDDNFFGWPLGQETQGNTSINRTIQNGAYVWSLTTTDPNISWMGLNLPAPESAARLRYSAEIRLPDFDPLTCAGLMFGGDSNSFFGYVVCNDKTYSLLHYINGDVQTLIPYSQIKDFDNFSAAEISAEITDGWVDLYYGENSLDTYNVGYAEGSFGLIAMPQSTSTTNISFGRLTFETSDTAPETTFQASAVDPNASDSVSRLVKMLNMKKRIQSTAGTYVELPDKEMSLAMMGYNTRESAISGARNLLLQADISWESGYSRPDYANSGCGFFIRETGTYSFIEIFAAMDGGIYVNAYRNGALVPLISLKYANWSIEGNGKLAVAADEQKITILWNDSILGTVTDATWIGEGNAGTIVHSGTNGDFGTRCTFTNTEAYIFNAE